MPLSALGEASRVRLVRQMPDAPAVVRPYCHEFAAVLKRLLLRYASRLSGSEGRKSGFGPPGDQGQPGQALAAAMERLARKLAVIEAAGVLR